MKSFDRYFLGRCDPPARALLRREVTLGVAWYVLIAPSLIQLNTSMLLLSTHLVGGWVGVC